VKGDKIRSWQEQQDQRSSRIFHKGEDTHMHFSAGLKQIRHWSPFFITAVALGLFFSSTLTVRGEYNDYSVNKPSAFRDYQQVMIWDSEIFEALSGFRGTLMFSTGSCFSGGFIDDLTNLENAAVVTANNWHGFGLSL
jgi:hypothetical protein